MPPRAIHHQEVLGSNPSLLQSGKTDPLTYDGDVGTPATRQTLAG
jgi:hypothetical protein